MHAYLRAGTIYKLRLVLADATGQHDAFVKLFEALPGADPAYELKAVSSSDAAPIMSGNNGTDMPVAGAYGASNPTSPQIQAAAALAIKVSHRMHACMGRHSHGTMPLPHVRRTSHRILVIAETHSGR